LWCFAHPVQLGLIQAVRFLDRQDECPPKFSVFNLRPSNE